MFINKDDIRNHPDSIQNDYSWKNQFIENEEYFNLVKVLTNLNPKFILAGSVSLHVLGLMDIDFKTRKPDLDLCLSAPLTEEEFDVMVNLLDLEVLSHNDSYMIEDLIFGENKILTTSEILKSRVIRLHDKKTGVNIDIFNSDYNSNYGYSRYENLYPVNFGVYERAKINLSKSGWPMTGEDKLIPHIVYVQHPSVTISHKMKFAMYTNYGKNKKHKNDCIDILCKQYDTYKERLNQLDKKKKQFISLIKLENKSIEQINNTIHDTVYEFAKH